MDVLVGNSWRYIAYEWVTPAKTNRETWGLYRRRAVLLLHSISNMHRDANSKRNYDRQLFSVSDFHRARLRDMRVIGVSDRSSQMTTIREKVDDSYVTRGYSSSISLWSFIWICMWQISLFHSIFKIRCNIHRHFSLLFFILLSILSSISRWHLCILKHRIDYLLNDTTILQIPRILDSNKDVNFETVSRRLFDSSYFSRIVSNDFFSFASSLREKCLPDSLDRTMKIMLMIISAGIARNAYFAMLRI